MSFQLRPRLHAALFLAGLTAARAAPAAAQAPLPAPEPGSELTVYLMTFGPGDLSWERFGHNALWIHDGAAGTDLAYNYGLFDFEQENFFLRFAQGRMLYSMGGFDAAAYAEFYREQNRSVWVQELDLTPAERLELQRFLQWNDTPGNREYRYDYYRDNCSTRVRDAIDRILGGRLRERTEGVPTGATYRSHTRRLTAEDPVLYTGLLLGLGEPVDRPITAWEEMFLPLRMREHLRSITIRDAAGREVPLVKSERTLFEAARPPLPDSPPSWIPGYLAAGAALGGLLALLGSLAAGSAAARFGFAALGALWSLFAGTGGLILAGLWALTDHAAAYRNENLFQLEPLSLALVVLLPALAYGAHWAARPARAVALAVAGIAALGLVAQLLPGFDQVNGEVIALTLPVHLGLAAGVHLRRRRARAAVGRTPGAPAAPRFPPSPDRLSDGSADRFRARARKAAAPVAGSRSPCRSSR